MKTRSVAISLALVLSASLLMSSCAAQKPAGQSASASASSSPGALQFDKNNSIGMKVPSGWTMKKETPTTVLPIDKKIEVKLMPPAGEKASMIVTIGKTNGNLDSERSLLFSLVQDRVDNLLPNAVEDAPSYQPLDLDHPAEKPSFHMVPPYYPGMGTYFILTDSSLVRKSSKELGPDEYLYIAEYVGLYKDGCVVYASLLTDDTNSDSFKQMLDMLTSINPQFK